MALLEHEALLNSDATSLRSMKGAIFHENRPLNFSQEWENVSWFVTLKRNRDEGLRPATFRNNCATVQKGNRTFTMPNHRED